MATPVPMSEQTLIVYCAMSVTRERAVTMATPPTTASPPTPTGRVAAVTVRNTQEQDEERQRERDHLGAEQVVLEDAVEVVHVRHAARCRRCSARSEWSAARTRRILAERLAVVVRAA